MIKPDDRIVIRIDEDDYPELYAMVYGAGAYKRAKVARRLILAGFEAITSGKTKCSKNCGENNVDDRNQSRNRPPGRSRPGGGPDEGGLLFDDDIEL